MRSNSRGRSFVASDMRSSIAAAALLLAACATDDALHRVRAYRNARARGDAAAEARYLAPGARMYFEEKTGLGEPLKAGKSGSWAHWDDYFRSQVSLTDWKVEGNMVSAVVHETNEFYQLLEWEPRPYRMMWWVDDSGRITEALVQRIPGPKVKSRLDEFKAWAREHHPEELAYLMPGDRIDPTGDRPERVRRILDDWRRNLSDKR